MPVEITVPQMAESILEATVGQWLKSEGDPVAAGEAVLELETDKVSLEVTSTGAGVLQKILRQPGDTVTAGEVLGVLGEGAAPQIRAQPQAAAAPVAADSSASNGKPSEATPVARRLAAASGVDLTTVPGTGRGGKITKEDVQAAMSPPTPSAPPADQSAAGTQPRQTALPAPAVQADRTEERVRLSRRRLTIAQRMAEVQRDAVMTTTYNEADMTNIMALRKKYREKFQEKHGIGLGFMSFFVKAVVVGLKFQRVLNSELQGEELVYKNHYDIGIAVSTDDGLVVPVVRDADRKSFAEIESNIRELAGRARDKKLTLEDLRGATFTITNGGVFGSMFSTPILNPPQVAILGMHAIKERPMVSDGQIVIRPMMYLAVTYDHRVVEGADSVQFLVRVKEMIEDPERLMIDV